MLRHHARDVDVPATGTLEVEAASHQTLALAVRVSRKVDERGSLERCADHLSKHDVIIHQFDNKVPCVGLILASSGLCISSVFLSE